MKKLSKRDIKISVGIIPVRLVDNKYLFLLLRSGNHWDMPKGRIEKNENILEAALRETEEETTISVKDLHFIWGKQYKESDVYRKGTKIAIYFIAKTDRKDITLPISEELGRPEHDEFKWVTYKEAKKLVNKRIKKILDWANAIIIK